MTRLLFRLITFVLIPSIVLYSFDAPVATIPVHSIESASILPDDYLFTYDDVLDLIEELEEGDLEKRCTLDQLARINEFLARLARAGLLPDESSEELEKDIEDLLINPYENEFSFAPPTSCSYIMVPAFFTGYGQVSLCKGWWHKTWDQSKKFVKKHKKAILIGVAVVVVATVVVCSVVAITAATAAAAASLDSDKKDSSFTPPSTVQTAIEEHVSSFKEIVVEDDLFQSTSQNEESSFGERAREIGSCLAHETLNGIASLISVIPEGIEEIQSAASAFIPASPSAPDNILVSRTPVENWERLIASAHQKIDQIFSTEQGLAYSLSAKELREHIRAELGFNDAIAILPPPGALGESLTGNIGRIAATAVSDVWGWKIGEKITNRTLFGTVPKWSTIRRRYWKNQAYSHPEKYEIEQLERMKEGLAPQRMTAKGELESMELHHIPPQREGGLFDFVEVWPDEHALLDEYRSIGK